MGQRMPDEPIEYGDDCLNCFAPGKTPKYVYVRFSLIKKCTYGWTPPCKIPPNDIVFKLTQEVGNPCYWHYEQSGWHIHFRAWYVPTAGATLRIWDADGYGYFMQDHTGCIEEGFVWHAYFTSCTGAQCGHSGIAVVTWTPQATKILQDIVIEKGPNLFMELWPRPDGKLVYKFCRLQDATNIKILFEP